MLTLTGALIQIYSDISSLQMYSADPDGSIAQNIICRLHGTWVGGGNQTGFIVSSYVDPDGNIMYLHGQLFTTQHFALEEKNIQGFATHGRADRDIHRGPHSWCTNTAIDGNAGP